MASIAFHDPRLASVSGGAETVTLQLVSLLIANGHEITVATRKSLRSPVFEQAVRQEPRLQYHEIETSEEHAGNLLTQNDLARRIWDCDRLAPESVRFNLATRSFYQSHRFDLVVVSFIPDLALLATKDRVLLNIFGLPPNAEIALIERPLLAQCCHMTFASQFTKLNFLRLFDLAPAHDPGPVVYASVQWPFFEPSRAEPKRFDLCFVGRLTTRKGVYTILEAVALLKRQGREATLAMVGDGQERAALSLRAAALGISNQLTWFGAIGSAEVAQILGQSHCFLAPALKPEAFACGNIEAMARGVPVVTTNLGGMTDYIRSETNALVCKPGCAESLARSAVRVLDNPELTERLRANGLATAQRFHPNSASEMWLKVFAEALRAGPCD